MSTNSKAVEQISEKIGKIKKGSPERNFWSMNWFRRKSVHDYIGHKWTRIYRPSSKKVNKLQRSSANLDKLCECYIKRNELRAQKFDERSLNSGKLPSLAEVHWTLDKFSDVWESFLNYGYVIELRESVAYFSWGFFKFVELPSSLLLFPGVCWCTFLEVRWISWMIVEFPSCSFGFPEISWTWLKFVNFL